MIISLLHDSKDIPFWGAYECRFGSIGTLNRHFGTLVRPQRKNRMELSRSRFVLLRRLRMAFLSPFFSSRHSLNKFGSVHGLAKTFSLIVRRTAVRSYPTQGYALFARVRMHPSPAMDGDAIQRRIVPKVIPGR